ncbi:MAG TPA: hypothetical protein VGF69_23575 [Thermoanaerobaculia bacterium]|jgi:hypothetical protein
MPRFAELQQPQAAKETTRETARGRARRANAPDRQSPAASVSNQRMQRKLRNAAKQQKQQEEQPPGPDEKAEAIAELLRGDAEDQSGVARGRLESLPEDERAEVTERVQGKLSEGDRSRASATLAAPAPLTIEPAAAPAEEKQKQQPATEAREQLEQNEEEQLLEKEQDEEPEAEGKEKKKEARRRTPLELLKKAEPATTTPPADETAEAKPEVEPPSVAKAPPQPGAVADPGAAATPEGAPAPEGMEAAPEGKAPAPAPVSGETPAPAEGGAPSAPAQATAGKALEAMGAPAESRAAVSAGGGAAAAKAPAPTPAPAAGGGGGGGGGGGAAALEEEGPESPEAEETEEKMAEAERDEDDSASAEPEPSDEDLSAEKSMEESDTASDAENEEQAKAAAEEEEAAKRAPDEPQAEEEEDAPPAESVELPAAERDAALESLGDGGGAEGGAGGGGGGGGAIADKEEPAPPDVSTAPPAEAMATVSSMKVGQIAGAVASVSAAVDNKVSEKKSDLAADPPSMERPSGAPETKDARGGAEAEGEGAAAEGDVEEVAAEGESVSAEEQLEELPDPGPSPTDDVSTPAVRGSEGGEMSDEDIDNIEAAIDNLPTTDPALAETAGPPPVVELAGEADPAVAEEQRTQLDETTANLETEGAADAAADMGENEIYPVVPDETLTATAGGEGGAGGGSAVEVDDDTAAIVAEEKEGDTVRAEASAAQGEMAQAEADQQTEEAKERTDHDQKVQQAVEENESQQTEQRASAKAEVEAKRGEWTTEQRSMVDQSRTDADSAMTEADSTVEAEQTAADEKAEQEIEAGNEEATTARKDAERDAKQEKKAAESESDGFFGWLASAATSFFNGVISAIGAVFEAARALVKAAIEAAQKAAAAIIDAARNAIIAAIRLAGDALMGLADVLLAGFPELRDRVKGAIKDTVAAAEDAVNELADSLKRGIQELLDALGKALDAVLGLLEKGLKAAVEAVAAAVKGAIAAAKAAIDALATFAQLVRDVAADPGQWLANLGAAIIDGIQNHLWAALKSAVKEWFNAKLEAVLGIGAAIWEVLKKGSITIAQVGQMAFTALKAAIPMMLIQLLVEKLVAMIVPAAGAVMAIVEGLQAAWGTVSQIIAAIGKFITFLKAVKTGGAGPQFAAAVASAAVAVIEFVSNWLLAKLITPAKKVGGKVKAMAGRIMAKLKKLGQKIARAARKVVGKIKKGLKKLGKKLGLGKKKGKKSRTKKDKAKAQDRLDKAVRELVPKIKGMSRKGLSGLLLRPRLFAWKTMYRLTRLSLDTSGEQATVRMAANPEATPQVGYVAKGEFLRRLTYECAKELVHDDPTVAATAAGMTGKGTKANPINVPAGPGIPALVKLSEEGKLPGFTSAKQRTFSHDGVSVVETPGQGRDPRNAFVEGIGTYRGLPRALSRMRKGTDMTEADMAIALRTFTQSGVVDPRLKGKEGSLAAMRHLMFGREGMRGPQALVQSMMTMDMIASGASSERDAFRRFKPEMRGRFAKGGTGGGNLAYTMAGSSRASRRLYSEIADPNSRAAKTKKRRSFAARRMAARESRQIAAWIATEFGPQALIYVDKATAERELKRIILERLRQFYLSSQNVIQEPLSGAEGDD